MEHDDEPTPRRFRTLRPNPLRDVLPWVVVGLGLVLVVRGVIDLGRQGGTDQLLIGVGLAVLGVVVFLINRWQAHREL